MGGAIEVVDVGEAFQEEAGSLRSVSYLFVLITDLLISVIYRRGRGAPGSRGMSRGGFSSLVFLLLCFPSKIWLISVIYRRGGGRAAPRGLGAPRGRGRGY